MWDDWALIVRTVGFRGFNARHLAWMLTTTHMANNTPLAWLSYGLDYALWGLNPAGYHLTNLLLHAANAALMFRVSARLLERGFSGRMSPAAATLGAAAAALAFGLHPMRAESVAWASERRDVLAGFFCLSSILTYLRAEAASGRDAARDRAASIALYAAAALCKATIVPLPLALLAADVFPLKRLAAGEPAQNTRAVLLEKLPYLAVAAAAATMAVRAQVASGNLVAVAAYGWSERLAQAVEGAGFYVRKTFLPLDLHALYPLGHPAWTSSATGAGAVTLAAAAAAGAVLGIPRRAQAALWGYYLLFLLPVLGLVQNGRQLVALRYSYLSCLGWAVLVGAAAALAQDMRERKALRGSLLLAALSLWLAWNAAALQRQLALWRDDRTLWGDVLAAFPGSVDAAVNLADALLQVKDFADAESRARAALALEPSNRSARLTLAKALEAQGRRKDARATLEQDAALTADWGEGQAMLGAFLAEEGKDEQAWPLLRRAAELLPRSAAAQSDAGSFLALRGKFAEALPYFEKAAALDPAHAGQLARVRADLARAR